MNVNEIMATNVITVKGDTTVKEIADILVKNNISGVPVIDDNGEVIGIVTQKDLLYKDIEPRFPAVVEILGGLIFLSGVKHYNEELKKIVATKAEDIMTKDVVTVGKDADIEKVAELMIEKDINRVPVVENKKLIGIISREDIIRHIAGKMK